jgi:hypothetical protein
VPALAKGYAPILAFLVARQDCLLSDYGPFTSSAITRDKKLRTNRIGDIEAPSAAYPEQETGCFALRGFLHFKDAGS